MHRVRACSNKPDANTQTNRIESKHASTQEPISTRHLRLNNSPPREHPQGITHQHATTFKRNGHVDIQRHFTREHPATHQAITFKSISYASKHTTESNHDIHRPNTEYKHNRGSIFDHRVPTIEFTSSTFELNIRASNFQLRFVYIVLPRCTQ